MGFLFFVIRRKTGLPSGIARCQKDADRRNKEGTEKEVKTFPRI